MSSCQPLSGQLTYQGALTIVGSLGGHLQLLVST